METIHIAVASNQNYFCGLLVTVGSIAYHASRDVNLMFHVLDGGIQDQTFSEMYDKIKRLHPRVKLNRISVNEDLFRNYPTWVGNRMAYARFMLPEALPNVSHIIYSDVDFLWLIDIAQLWDECSDEEIFHGVLDAPGTISKEEKWFRHHNLPFDSNSYFCFGMSIYNLDKFREEGTVQKLIEFLDCYPDVQFPDQAALNFVLRGRVKLLPEKWQTFSTSLTPQRVKGPLAIHYAGDAPWARGKFWTYPISDSTLLWYAMLDYINGVRPGTSIKSHLSLWQRIYKRSLANIHRYSAARTIFNYLLRVTGRASYISNLDKFAIDLKLSKKVCRQIVLNR